MKNDATGWYANTFKGWQSKLLGRKPTAAELAIAHAFGKPGKQSLALAMAMRENGVTAGQIQIACGAPQNNHRRGLITEGMFKREAVPPSNEGHTVYKITLSPKGDKALKAKAEAPKAEAKADKPAKAVKAAKAPRKHKAKVAPAEAPASDPVTVTEAPVDNAVVNEAPATDTAPVTA